MTAKSLLYTLPLTLYDGGAVKINIKEGEGFKLKLHETKPEAPLSPIYLNLRTPDNPKPGPLTPKIVSEIGYAMWSYVRKTRITCDAVAGLPNAGTPLAKAFAEAALERDVKIPVIQLGKTTSPDGARKIEGILDADGAVPPERVLVIDDLITRGDSKKEGIEALTKAGFRVDNVLVLVDREQGGAEDLRKMGVGLCNLLTLKLMVIKLCDAGKISQAEKDRVLEYLANN